MLLQINDSKCFQDHLVYNIHENLSVFSPITDLKIAVSILIFSFHF